MSFMNMDAINCQDLYQAVYETACSEDEICPNQCHTASTFSCKDKSTAREHNSTDIILPASPWTPLQDSSVFPFYFEFPTPTTPEPPCDPAHAALVGRLSCHPPTKIIGASAGNGDSFQCGQLTRSSCQAAKSSSCLPTPINMSLCLSEWQFDELREEFKQHVLLVEGKRNQNEDARESSRDDDARKSQQQHCNKLATAMPPLFGTEEGVGVARGSSVHAEEEDHSQCLEEKLSSASSLQRAERNNKHSSLQPDEKTKNHGKMKAAITSTAKDLATKPNKLNPLPATKEQKRKRKKDRKSDKEPNHHQTAISKSRRHNGAPLLRRPQSASPCFISAHRSTSHVQHRSLSKRISSQCTRIEPMLPPSPVSSPELSPKLLSTSTFEDGNVNLTSSSSPPVKERPNLRKKPRECQTRCDTSIKTSSPKNVNGPRNGKMNKRVGKPSTRISPAALCRGNQEGDIPKSLQLFEFLLHLLELQKARNCVKWDDTGRGCFQILDSCDLANKWGVYRAKPEMNYDKMSRAMRFYYKRQILDKTSGRLHYKFTEMIMKQVEQHRQLHLAADEDKTSESESEKQ